MSEDLVYRLRKRAEIRRQITTRKSVQEGKADRIADLLEEAAGSLDEARALLREAGEVIRRHSDSRSVYGRGCDAHTYGDTEILESINRALEKA